MDTSTQVGPGTKKRRGWVAGLLGLLVAGLGQIYNGQARKGLAGYLGFMLLLIVTVGLVITSPPWVIGLCLFLVFLLRLYLVVDGVVVARRLGSAYTLKRYNRWPIYVMALVLLDLGQLGVSRFLRTYVFQPYSIPSVSLEPTILNGDRLWVDKLRYRFSDPQRLDWVIFTSPEDAKVSQMKRVVGIPGDKIQITAGQLFVNGQLQVEPYVSKRRNEGMALLGSRMRFLDYFGPHEVPAGHYFVLGDNRDNSYDSRFFGPVSRSLIQGGGRVVRYWSSDPRSGKVRWDRIGDVVR